MQFYNTHHAFLIFNRHFSSSLLDFPSSSDTRKAPSHFPLNYITALPSSSTTAARSFSYQLGFSHLRRKDGKERGGSEEVVVFGNDMKVEDSSLTRYLVKNLQTLTVADPVILAEYVVALLKKDKPTTELQKLCLDNLVDFLGHSTESFTINLFKALEDGSIVRPVVSSDPIKKPEHSTSSDAVDALVSKKLLLKDKELFRCKKEHELCTSSGSASDHEDQEISDDDDRNHKHRRRDPQIPSFENDDLRQFVGRSRGRRNVSGDGALFHGSHLRIDEVKGQNSPSFERDLSLKFEKRGPSMSSIPQVSTDLNQRNRVPQVVRNDLTSLGRPLGGRGRGRGMAPRNQQDSRFMPLGSLEFSHMASQGPAHPNTFVATNLPSAATIHGTSWGPYGFVPGMPSMCLDPLNPLGLQGNVHSSMNSNLNLGMPRQRCRDFEEKGFCLRGDMCPMEHGLNRIVVEDVQSLSQFNLPVSVPSTHSLGLQAGSHISNSIMNMKSLPSKSSKIGRVDGGLEMNEALHSSIAGVDSDVYDPDQPLWNNDNSETSKGLLKLPRPKVDGIKQLWDLNPPNSCVLKISGSIENEELPSSNHIGNTSSHGRQHSCLDPELKMVRAENLVISKDSDDMKGGHLESFSDMHVGHNHRKMGIMDEGDAKTMGISSVPQFCKDMRRNTTWTSHKAFRTLFVSGIPQDRNQKNVLLSHFEKFGNVIDIYIPQNSEKAFVQFSKREEAETALRAPDAVMGNRFIKLFWANRDNITDDQEVKISGKPVDILTRTGSSVPLKPTSRASHTATGDATMSVVLPKVLTVTTPKPVQKKQELELLKEELRKKQELLEQKRNAFRAQLDNLEKQTVLLHKVRPSGQPFKKHKQEKDANTCKTPTEVEMASCKAVVSHSEAKKPDGSIIMNHTASNHSNTDSEVDKQSAKCLMQANDLPIPSVHSQPTGFRILPPLPAEFSDVTIINAHFSTFPDLSTVELEDLETESSNATSKPSTCCSARITFTSNHSAEKAFLAARCWEGHDLKFAWLTASSIIRNHSFQEAFPGSNHKAVEAAKDQPQPLSSSETPACYTVSNEEMSEADYEKPKTIDTTNARIQIDVDDMDCHHESPRKAISNHSISSE